MTENLKKKRNKGEYVIGSIILCAGAMILMPKIIDTISSYLYKRKGQSIDNCDEWGPEIVRKEEIERGNNNGCL